MGLIFGIIKRLLKWAVCFLLFALIIVLIPNLPPYTSFTSIPTEPTLQRVGPLAPNGALNNAEKAYKGKLLGPEAFQLFNGELYTGLATGEIVKVSPGGHVTFVTKIGQPCTGLAQEHICGRPLGFEIHEQKLYVADAYHGIWKVDLKTDKKQLLVSPRVDINGRKPMLFNSLVTDKKGNLFWTDSSSNFNLKDGAIAALADPSGRLLQYNAAKNESKVLLDNLWLTNGIVLSPDEQFVVIAESFKYRMLKYYINGPKKGKSEVFVSGLPGTPDNIRVLPDGSGVLVALYTVFDDENPLLSKSMSETPIVRKFVARLQKLIEVPFEFLNNLYPHFVFEDITYNIGHFKSVSGFTSGISGLVHIDWNGNIVASYYNTDGSLPHISDAIVYNDKLYTGSPHGQDFIGSVPAPPSLIKAFKLVKKETVTKEAPKAKLQSEPKQAKPKEQVPKQKVQEPIKEAPKVAKVESTKSAAQQAKPTENIKLNTKKPIEMKQETAQQATKPTQPPPQKVEQKSTTPPTKPEPTAKMSTQSKPNENRPTTAKPEIKTTSAPKATPPQKKETPTTTPKPEVKSTPASDEKKTESTKPAATKPEATKSKKSEPKQKKVVKETPKTKQENKLKSEIPIREEIPSDTAKPSAETLKVIKRDGPAEIPNPHL